MTTTIDRKALLTPWADAPCPECDGIGSFIDDTVSSGSDRCVACQGSGLDPRFAALRGEHDWYDRTCRGCGFYDNPLTDDEPPPYCLRTDLGALVRVAAACGPGVLDRVCQAVADAFGKVEWAPRVEALKWGKPPEDAAATALVAALPERAS